MILKVLIADDDCSIGSYLKKVIEEVPDVSVVDVVDNGKDAVRQVEILKPHAVFLDIDMPEMNGIEAARELAEVEPELSFVFVTAFPDYALEAFELYSVDYVLKPFDEKRIKKTVRKLKDKLVNEQNNFPQSNKILIDVDGRTLFIELDEILYVESHAPSLTIKTINNEEYTVIGSLQAVESRLSQDFFRCHKGYIVNLKYVKQILPTGRTYQVLLDNGDKVSLSRDREKIILERYGIRN